MTSKLFKIYKPKSYISKLGSLFVFLLVINSCTTTYNTISNRDFNNKYTPSQQFLHPEYTIYSNTPDDIRLYFRIFPREFQYLYNQDSVLFAKASLFFRVTKDYNSIHIIDSLTKNFIFKENPRSSYMGYVPLNLKEEGHYVIEVFLSDKLAKYSTSSVLNIEVNKQGNNSSYLFLSKYGSPLFYNHQSVEDTIRVRSSMFNDNGVIVQYYKPDTLLPKSPDLISNQLIDPLPIDTIYQFNHPDTLLFPLSKAGNYLFKNKSEQASKLINSFNKHYPYIKTPKQMLSCLRYLCTPEEMKGFYKKNNDKNAVDSFWLSTTNDLEKARELIRVFYNRIQLSNYYFTSFKEGWLTDMGMIYTICGAPASVKIDQDGEHWYYGKGIKENMTFHFYKEYHPEYGEIYVLDRSDIYSEVWYNAISTWRQGRVFSLNP